jgi:hypothetical protein
VADCCNLDSKNPRDLTTSRAAWFFWYGPVAVILAGSQFLPAAQNAASVSRRFPAISTRPQEAAMKLRSNEPCPIHRSSEASVLDACSARPLADQLANDQSWWVSLAA